MYEYERLAAELRKAIEEDIDQGITRLPTQEALCRKYGVSRVTVRRALSLLEEEGYIESRQGSGSILTGLSPEKKQNEVFLLVQDPDAYVMPELTSSIRTAIVRKKWTLSVCRTDWDFQKERDILLELLERPVPARGIITEDPYPLSTPNEDLYQKLSARGCRIIFLYGKDSSLKDTFCLRADVRQTSREAVSRLALAGHSRIAGLFPMSGRMGIEECSAWLQALRENGLSLSKDRLLLPGSADMEEILRTGTSEILEIFLKKIMSSCTALVCNDDLLAYSAASILTRMGAAVPEDVSLISLHTSYLRRRMSLQIDSFELKDDPGEAAVRLLLQNKTILSSKGTSSETPDTVTLELRYLPGNSIRQRR